MAVLREFGENNALQALLNEHDVVVSWDDEKRKVVVATSPQQSVKFKEG